MKSILKNKNGSFADVFIFIVTAFAIVVFFGILYYAFGLFNNAFTSFDFTIGTGTHAENFSNIVSSTWGQVYSSYTQMKTLSYVLIFGMILTIFVSAWAVRRPPIFLIIWIITSLVAIIAGAQISNAYQMLLTNTDFGATLESFKGGSYMILYLPYLAAIISLIAGLISMAGLNRSNQEKEVKM